MRARVSARRDRGRSSSTTAAPRTRAPRRSRSWIGSRSAISSTSRIAATASPSIAASSKAAATHPAAQRRCATVSGSADASATMLLSSDPVDRMRRLPRDRSRAIRTSAPTSARSSSRRRHPRKLRRRLRRADRSRARLRVLLRVHARSGAARGTERSHAARAAVQQRQRHRDRSLPVDSRGRIEGRLQPADGRAASGEAAAGHERGVAALAPERDPQHALPLSQALRLLRQRRCGASAHRSQDMSASCRRCGGRRARISATSSRAFARVRARTGTI